MAYKKGDNDRNDHRVKSTSWLPKLVSEGLQEAVEECENEREKSKTLSNLWIKSVASLRGSREAKTTFEVKKNCTMSTTATSTSDSRVNGNVQNYTPDPTTSFNSKREFKNGKFRLTSSHPLLQRKIIPLPPTLIDVSANHRSFDHRRNTRSIRFSFEAWRKLPQ